MNSSLYMVQLQPEPRALIRFLAERGLNSSNDEDLGYGTHAWLRAMFGYHAPQPFRLFNSARSAAPTKLLGYTTSDPETLVEHAATFAEPTAKAVCDINRALATAPLPGPEAWRVGRRLGFEVLICPVAREARTGKEQDLFLHEATRTATQAGLRRESVYLDWLAGQLGDAAALEQGSLKEFRLVKQLRRGCRRPDGPRPSTRLVRPRALVRGTLIVRDPEGFASLLARGIGRHRSFGYGMLLLKPTP